MKQFVYGHAWHGGRHGPIRLLSAMHCDVFYAGRLRFRHPTWVVDYVINTSGRVRVASPARPWRARLPRTLHLYPPNTVYWEDYPGARKSLCDYQYAFFRGGEGAGLDRLIHPRAGYARFLDPEGLAEPLLEEMALIGRKSGDDGFWQAQAAFCRLIDLLLKSQPVEDETRLIGRPASVAPPSDLVRETDAYLSTHMADRILLADLAEHLHISVSALSHRYQAETGATPMTRLAQLRLKTAKTMLMGRQKLSTIVEVAGFSDAAHLSRTFKRAEGVSPREYLRARAKSR